MSRRHAQNVEQSLARSAKLAAILEIVHKMWGFSKCSTLQESMDINVATIVVAWLSKSFHLITVSREHYSRALSSEEPRKRDRFRAAQNTTSSQLSPFECMLTRDPGYRLDVGCNHMTCHCRAQFCYVCGERWKTCACEQWDEDRIVARADQVVEREPAPMDPPRQAARIAAVVPNLGDRHDCEHERWRGVRGEHQCEECYHTLPESIFEIRQCNIRACNRCRRNRL